MALTRVLIANIKNMGQCPCPRCCIHLKEVNDLGKASDSQRRADTRRRHGLFRVIKKARKAAFNGFKVSGSRIEVLMQGLSRIPINVGIYVP